MKPYWTLSGDNFLVVAGLDLTDAADTGIAAARPGFTIALMQENAELARSANIKCADVEELIETIINLTSPDSDHRESFYTIYAHGGCDVFAVALQRIIGGDIYAVNATIADKGKRVRIPHLVHAGDRRGVVE